MGTAGLRKKVSVFQQANYLECFLQAVLDTLALREGATVVLGGDGRYFNREAIPTIIRVACANGVRRLIIGRSGLLSTPAASTLIRSSRADGGFLLTASHNPGGPDGDFGIKFNMANGGQAPPQVTDAVYERSRALTGYRIADMALPDLDQLGVQQIGPVCVEIVDPVDDYLRLMQQLFDFDLISDWMRSGHRVLFDALHGITGPYAHRILCATLGASADCLLHAEPLPDFGGLHPDPNPTDARELVARSAAAQPPDLLAASDGDGDRNMILGPDFMLSPGDSVALMLAHTRLVPGYRDGVPGVARSMPTSRALDAVAGTLGIPCYETPTGWRYFCNLLDAGRIGLCGEESFGTGSSHTREKDGLWAVLYWMNLLAASRSSLPALVHNHWQRFGRHYYQRHDYEIPDAARAEELIAVLRKRLPQLTGTTIDSHRITLADDFLYRDPIDGSESARQGIRIVLENDSRVVYRLSGTGTAGATLRVYLECYERDAARHALPLTTALASLASMSARLAEIGKFTGLTQPSMTV
jgi:phosphoglucomutase